MFLDLQTFIKTNCSDKNGTKSASLYYHPFNATNFVIIRFCLFDGFTNPNCKAFLIQNAHDITFSHNLFENIGNEGNPTENCIGEIFVLDKTVTIDHCKFNHIIGSSMSVSRGNEIRIANSGTLKSVSVVYSSCEWTENRAVFSQSSGIHSFSKNGIDQSFSSVSLSYTNSTFLKNKSDKEGGGAFIFPNSCSLTNFDVSIEDCIFNGNEAKEHGGAISIELEGKGGSICINTMLDTELLECNSYLKEAMSMIQIENCLFDSNQAQNGHAVYLKGQDYGTKINIVNNTFIDNLREESGEEVTSIILSEICSISETELIKANNFTFDSKSVVILQSECINYTGSDFSKSFRFTSIVDFTESQHFSKTQMFSNSDLFSESSSAEQEIMKTASSLFSNSLAFTESKDFLSTSSFSSSSKFSKSLPFNPSDNFTPSNSFTHSNTTDVIIFQDNFFKELLTYICLTKIGFFLLLLYFIEHF